MSDGISGQSGKGAGSMIRAVRLQLSRAKGFSLQAHSRAINGLAAVNVARPSRYGNMHHIGWCPNCGAHHTSEEAVREFAAEIDFMDVKAWIKETLGGKNLACWCPLDGRPCHADVLLRIANG